MASILDYLLPGLAQGDPMGSFLTSIGVSPANGLQVDTTPTTPPPVPQGTPAAPAPAQPLANTGQIPPSQTSQVQPQTDVTNGQSIEVTGDAWKPKHTSFLGTLADVLMGAPVFHNQTKKENLVSAMQGFDEDPIRSIRRVEKIDPAAAYNMWNTYQDNQRGQQQVDLEGKKYSDTVADHAIGVGMSMLGAANEKNYPQMKEMVQQYWATKKVTPPFNLPDTYDPDTLQGLFMGEIKPEDQVRLKQENNYNQARIGVEQENFKRQAGYQAARLEQHDEELGETVRNHQVMEGIAEGRLQQGQTRVGLAYDKVHPKVVPTPNGPMVLSPDGTRGRIGDTIWTKTGPGQWKVLGKAGK